MNYGIYIWERNVYFWSVAPIQFYRRHIIESIVGRRSFHSSSLTNSHSLGLLVMLYCHCLLLHHRHFDDVAKVVLPWCHLKPKSASSSRQNFFLTSPKDAEQKKRNPGRRRRQAYGRSTRQLQLNRTTCCHLSQRVEVKQALLLPFQFLRYSWVQKGLHPYDFIAFAPLPNVHESKQITRSHLERLLSHHWEALFSIRATATT